MTHTLYVGNLAPDTQEDALRAAFAGDDRTVTSVVLVKDTRKRGRSRSRGFGFVELESAEEATAAREALDGSEMDGREIRVRDASERKSGDGGFLGAYGKGKRRDDSGGGFGGFGGRGGGRRERW